MDERSRPDDLPAGAIALRFAAPRDRPVAVSCDPETVLRASGRPARLDARAALRLVAFGQYDAHTAFFEDVALVPPHAEVHVDPGGIVRWQVTPGPRPRGADLEEAAGWLAEALLAAIRVPLATARRAAVSLSGGLDSSAVAWAAATVWREMGRSPADLRAYHACPPWGATEEHHAEAVASALSMPFHRVPAPGGDPFEGTDEVLRALPFPPDGGGAAESLAFARRLRADGVDVLLTGDGGDEAFDAHLDDDAGRGLRAARAVLGPLVRPLLAARRRTRALRALPGWMQKGLGAHPLPDAAPPARPGLRGAAAARDRLLRCTRQQGIVAFHRAIDRVAGTRTSCPLLDPAVVDLVVALPAGVVAGDGRPKGILRHALAGRLPEPAVARPKDQPYVEPVQHREASRFGREWIDRHVRSGVLVSRGVVPVEAAEATLQAAVEGRPDALRALLALVGVGAWARAWGLDASR